MTEVEEFARLVAVLELRTSDLAGLFRVTTRTVQNWQRSEPPYAVLIVLRFIAKGGLSPRSATLHSPIAR